MVVNKRKKVTKYRAGTTHGGGHRKKRRGAGSRGGRGRAGTGKRAGQKVAGITSELGSHGFTSHTAGNTVKAVNLSYFTTKNLNRLVSSGKVSKDGESYIVILKKLGFDKLLGSGSVSEKINVVVGKYTGKAESKIIKAGGSISSPEVTKKE